jgi:hypothetical protein
MAAAYIRLASVAFGYGDASTSARCSAGKYTSVKRRAGSTKPVKKRLVVTLSALGWNVSRERDVAARARPIQ